VAKPKKDERTGTYRYRPVLNGKQIFCHLDTTNEREAIALAYNIDRAIFDYENGLRVVPDGVSVLDWVRSGGTKLPAIHEQHTFGELIESYRDSVPVGAKADSTMSTERTHLKHLAAHFGTKTTLQRIDTQAVEAYVKSRKDRDPVTLKKELSTLGLLWRHGERLGWVTGRVPTKGVRLPKKRQKERFRTYAEIVELLPTVSEKQHGDLWECCVLLGNEVKEFLDHVRTITDPTYAAAMVTAAAFTGARRSELMRSRRRDWDLKNKTLTIREKKRVHSASESFRYVDLHPELIRIMKPHLADLKGDLVFSDLPNVELGPVDAERVWYHVVKGTKWDRIRGWHVLRHSFASNLAAAGVPESTIDKFMGHQTREMRERYRHLFPADRHTAISALSSYA